LIKPAAGYPVGYPVTTSPGLIKAIVDGIRQVSDADILLLEGSSSGKTIPQIYKTLNYEFPRVLKLDAKDCISVEVDNPLNKPLAVPTFSVPNVVLSSDYLISVAPAKIVDGRAYLSIMNLLSILPGTKYRVESSETVGSTIGSLGIDKVVADLYFTLPFDLSIVEAKQVMKITGNPVEGSKQEVGNIFMGEPYEVDREVAETLGLKGEYLDLIRDAKAELEH